MKPLALCTLLALASCAPDEIPVQTAIGAGQLPPIQREYREMILNWGRHYYREPRMIAGPAISDPVLIRDTYGRLMWLVCVQAQNLGRGGSVPGPEIHAFGFAPGFWSSPLNRGGSPLVADDCQERPLTYRPFPQLARG